jgi:UDP-N-acetylglucosamine 4-epimerase
VLWHSFDWTALPSVFGARQDPRALRRSHPALGGSDAGQRPIVIYGDGATTRDFCYVANVVQANLLAATSRDPEVLGQVYNIAVGGKMPFNALFTTLRTLVLERHPDLVVPAPVYEGFRAGDIRHSQADIGKARRLLGYDPTCDVVSGLREALPWYEARLHRRAAGRIEAMQRVDDVT